MAAFRETYAELHELRSLAPDVKMLALTATATTSARQTITEILLANRKSASLEQDSAQQQIATLKEHLNDYHKFLVKELLDKSKNDQLKTLMNPQFLLGFSEH